MGLSSAWRTIYYIYCSAYEFYGSNVLHFITIFICAWKRQPLAKSWGGKSLFYFAAAFIFWVCGMASKENAAILPFLILLYEWFFYQNAELQWVKDRAWYLVGAFLSLLFVGFVYFGDGLWGMVFSDCPTRNFTAVERVYTQFRIVFRYLTLIFYPSPDRLIFDYDMPVSTSILHPITTLLCFMFFVIVGSLGFFYRKRNKIFAFAFFWFLAALAIESSFICLELYYEHRTYLPSIFIIFAFVTGLIGLLKNPLYFVPILTALCILFGSWTYQRNFLWADPVSFWQDNIEKNPTNPRPYNNLGNVLETQGDYENAKIKFLDALNRAPEKSLIYSNLGLVYYHLGELEKSKENYEYAYQIGLEDASAYIGYGLTLDTLNNQEELLNLLKEATTIYPDSFRLNKMFGGKLLKSSQPKLALEYLQHALEIREDSELIISIGMAFFQLGQFNDAEKMFNKVLMQDKENIPALYNLGLIFSMQGELEKAREKYEIVFKLERKKPPVAYNLGNTYFMLNRYQDAIMAYQEVLKTVGTAADALNNTGLAYIRLKDYPKAINAFEKVLKIFPDHEVARKNLLLCKEEIEKNKHE